MNWCLITLLLAQVIISSCGPADCDPSKKVVQGGNNGQTDALSWLGILRVNLFEGVTFRVALTGIVLVKEGYAIANADDVAKVPRTTLIGRSKAMFIPKPDTPWYCTVKDFLTHPEYQYSTMTTIALLELENEETNFFPMRPICWPPFTLNITSDLYAIGFTDDNQLLEKSVYKMQHIDLNICNDFYNRPGFTEGMLAPRSYVCGFAAGNKQNCAWDNGMVLVSNSTGYWKLIGFGVQGPGCSAPARFINMLSYFQWIDTATDQYDVDYDYRRTAVEAGTGLKKNVKSTPRDVPVHDLFSIQEVASRRQEWWPKEKRLDADLNYTFNTELYQDRYYTIQRIDRDNVIIWAENVSTPYQHGNCSSKNKMVYNEQTNLKMNGFSGRAIYKLSVMDLNELNFSCIDIKVTPKKLSATATIYYGVTIDNAEGMSDIEEIPPGILTHHIHRPHTEGKSSDDWEPGPQHKVKYIHDKYYVIKQPNINILLKFQYENEATYRITIYSSNSLTTTTTTTTDKPSSKKKNKSKKGKKPQYLREGAALPDKTIFSRRKYINETLTLSDMKKDMGVEVKEVDRQMKELVTSSSMSCRRETPDVFVSFSIVTATILFNLDLISTTRSESFY